MPAGIVVDDTPIGRPEIDEGFAKKYPKLAAFIQYEKTAAIVDWCLTNEKDIERLTPEDWQAIAQAPLRRLARDQQIIWLSTTQNKVPA
jgi:hypothetical protein